MKSKSSQKVRTIFTEATIPYASGAIILARIMLLTGIASFATISPRNDHFVAFKMVFDDVLFMSVLFSVNESIQEQIVQTFLNFFVFIFKC